MKLDWKVVLATGLGVLLVGIVIKAVAGMLPAAVSGYVPEFLKK